MNHRLLLSSLLTLLIVSFYSCTDSSAVIDHFEIAQTEYQVGENMDQYIHIISGNKDYSVTIENEELVEATYHPSSFDYGAFTIKGLKKGKTVMRIKDNVIGQEESLSITVTDGYLFFHISGPHIFLESTSSDEELENTIKKSINDDSLFKENPVLALINREENNLYLFEDRESLEMADYIENGEHELSADEHGSPQATFTLHGQPYTFSLEFSGGSLEMIQEIFGDHLPQKNTTGQEVYRDSPIEPAVIMTRDVTNLYKADYPELIKAEIKHGGIVIHPQTLFLPAELVE